MLLCVCVCVYVCVCKVAISCVAPPRNFLLAPGRLCLSERRCFSVSFSTPNTHTHTRTHTHTHTHAPPSQPSTSPHQPRNPGCAACWEILEHSYTRCFLGSEALPGNCEI